MKKIILLLVLISFAFISCTDNTTEHEEILKFKTHSINKEDSIHPTNGGEEGGNNEEE
ncbi:hypothetical protein [Tenacibaculum maritimum]|uniref:hypothetical protein n=1 Tax=Tenacibaculum maritimum TaxID=107401 RepID=UPI003875B6E2